MKKLTLGLLMIVLCGCGPNLAQEKQQAFSKHPEWSESMKESIMKKELVKGMTKEQVELSWDCTLSLDYEDSFGVVVYRADGVYLDNDLDGMSEAMRGFQRGLRSYMTKDCLFDFKGESLESWSCSPSERR